MGVATTLAVLGVVTAAAGTATSITGGARAEKANKAAMQASIRAEALRAEQMRMETFRRQREAVRQMIIGRATAVSNATQSGAQYGSGLQGGLGQITNVAGQGITAAGQNLTIGEGLFDANVDKARAETSLFSARTMSNTGAGLTALGGSLVQSSGTLGRVSNELFRGSPPAVSGPWGYETTLYARG